MQDIYQYYIEKFEWDTQAILEYLLEKSKTLDWLILWTKEVIKNYEWLLKEREIKLESIKKDIDLIMQKIWETKHSNKFWQISYRKSKSINILDESKILDKYIVRKDSYNISKKLIKEDIDRGVVVDGVEILEQLNLQIK